MAKKMANEMEQAFYRGLSSTGFLASGMGL